MYTACMKSSHATFFGLIVFVVALTFFFATSRDPEAQYVGSADGRMTVTGLARAGQDFVVTDETTVAYGAPLLGRAYRIDPVTAVLDAPVVVTFEKSRDEGTRDASMVYRWNAPFGMWEAIPPSAVHTDDVLGVTVNVLGIYAAGELPNVTMPTMLTLYDELRAKAPKGTRGYVMTVSYTLPNGVPVRVAEMTEIGGCGGRMDVGARTEYSSVAAEVMILVNDVMTPVTVTGVSEWGVSGDGVGCDASAPLRAQEL